MTDEMERRLRKLTDDLQKYDPEVSSDVRCARLDVAILLDNILGTPVACRIGGDPPVPGVGWGVTTTANHFGWRIVWAVRRVTFTEVGWSVGLDGEGGKGVAADEIEALYLPGAPADRPCWRRA